MNSILTLTFICLVTVSQVLCQFQPSAGASSLVGSVTGGVSNTIPDPTRWIEFVDMENNWSKLGTTYTIEAWILHSSSGQATWQPVLARHPGQNAPRQDAHFIIAIKNNNQIEVSAGCGCDATGKNCGNGFYLLASFSVSVWHHVAVTFNGENSTSATATLYVDGTAVDTDSWSSQDTQCLGRPAQWSEYASVKVGFLDDQAVDATSEANPNHFLGWWGRIDEIRFWYGIRSAANIRDYRNVGLQGSEDGLFAYYQFSPSQEVLDDPMAPKSIINKVGDWLHGLPQPNPTDAAIFAQTSAVAISTYSVVEGQSNQANLPPLPNTIRFESWPPSNTTTYTIPPGGYSVSLNNLLNNPNVDADLFVNPDGTVTLFVDCTNNDCSSYTSQWMSYYIDYTATVNGVTTSPARLYLQIVTACPSGHYDECGTCDGDNSLCQCVVYHGFESERMSYILLEWSIQSLIGEISDALMLISSTTSALTTSTSTELGPLRQQISDLMTFYNTELSPYCGEVHDFTSELQSIAPKSTLSAVDMSASPDGDGSVPFVPSFNINF